MDTTKKFDGLADDYSAGRPSYAKELIDCLYTEHGFSAESVIADIGSGTGKFSKLLLERGSTVYCVEPNDDMRSAAERELAVYGGFRSVRGGAEDTALKSGSVDFITTAQAFHWFDTEKFGRECARIIRENGKAVLIWNVRVVEAPVNRGLQEVFTAYCPDFVGFNGGMKKDDIRISRFFGGKYERVSFDNPLILERDKFLSRCLSGSYSLKDGDLRFAEYIEAITAVFEKYSENGAVMIPNRSVAYIGNVK